MTTRQIVFALAVAFPLAAITACDSQSESERLSSSPAPLSERQAPIALAQLDKDQDGTVSRSEAMDSNEIDERFIELDKDKDGRLSRSELEQASSLPR